MVRVGHSCWGGNWAVSIMFGWMSAEVREQLQIEVRLQSQTHSRLNGRWQCVGLSLRHLDEERMNCFGGGNKGAGRDTAAFYRPG